MSTPTHQYQLTDASGQVRDCGDASSITLTMDANGHIEAPDGSSSYTVNECRLYYIDNNSPFTVVITGVNPEVDGVAVTVLSGNSRAKASWVTTSTSLTIVFDGAEHDSSVLWQFDDKAPPLNLKVKVKRQPTAIDTSGCS